MKNNTLLFILISTLIALAAGALGSLLINTQTFSPYSYLGFGRELNLNNYDYLSSGLVIQEPKKVVVNQDLKIDETIAALRPSILGVFPKQTKASSSYYLSDAFAQALAATTDGWVMAAWPENTSELTASNWFDDYILIDSNRHIYQIEQALVAPPEAGWFVFFKLKDVTGLNVRRLVSDSEIRIGQSMLFLTNVDFVSLDFLSGKNQRSLVLSSDAYPYDLKLSDSSSDKSPSFIFNLSGDIIGALDIKGKWLPAPEMDAYWRSLFKLKEINRAVLGVSYLDLSSSLMTDMPNKGALLQSLSPKGAAASAGLKVGDIITKINSVEIQENQGLALLISGYNPGDRIFITYLRGNEVKEIEVTLAALR